MFLSTHFHLLKVTFIHSTLMNNHARAPIDFVLKLNLDQIQKSLLLKSLQFIPLCQKKSVPFESPIHIKVTFKHTPAEC